MQKIIISQKQIVMQKIILTLVATAIILLFFTSCEKLYRSSYTGKWDFVVEYASWNMADGWVERDTTYYLGKISIGATYNKLKIEYLENTKITMELNECGELDKEFEDHYEFAYGQFYGNDHVQINLGWRARGGGYYYIINGTKKGRK